MLFPLSGWVVCAMFVIAGLACNSRRTEEEMTMEALHAHLAALYTKRGLTRID